jgi:hypothetical protein
MNHALTGMDKTRNKPEFWLGNLMGRSDAGGGGVSSISRVARPRAGRQTNLHDKGKQEGQGNGEKKTAKPLKAICPLKYENKKIIHKHAHFRGTRWRSWLRHCATNRKVAGSILDGVTGIFH